MTRRLCQMWNYTPETLDQADASRLIRMTALCDIYDAEIARKANSGKR